MRRSIRLPLMMLSLSQFNGLTLTAQQRPLPLWHPSVEIEFTDVATRDPFSVSAAALSSRVAPLPLPSPLPPDRPRVTGRCLVVASVLAVLATGVGDITGTIVTAVASPSTKKTGIRIGRAVGAVSGIAAVASCFRAANRR